VVAELSRGRVALPTQGGGDRMMALPRKRGHVVKHLTR
jgi:hypothetical protein